MPFHCFSSSEFLQSHYTVLVSSFLLFSCFTSWCCCSLPGISLILPVKIVSFSVLSLFVAQIKNDCSDPVFLFCFFFLLTMFAKNLTGCFSHCCVYGGDHRFQVCILIAHDGERCKLPAYHSMEGFQPIGIFRLFEVKLESYVFWIADFFDFFSGEGGRSSSASRGHFRCLLLENFIFWQRSLPIGSASSLECN